MRGARSEKGCSRNVRIHSGSMGSRRKGGLEGARSVVGSRSRAGQESPPVDLARTHNFPCLLQTFLCNGVARAAARVMDRDRRPAGGRVRRCNQHRAGRTGARRAGVRQGHAACRSEAGGGEALRGMDQRPNVGCSIVIERVRLSSPTHFGEIYTAARAAVERHVADTSEPVALTFHLSPGTPAMAAVWIILGKTRYQAELIESSRQHGVKTASVPFDISAEFIPDLLSASDEQLRTRSAEPAPASPRVRRHRPSQPTDAAPGGASSEGRQFGRSRF